METGADISGTAMVKGEAAIKTALEAEGIEFIDDADVPRRASRQELCWPTTLYGCGNACSPHGNRRLPFGGLPTPALADREELSVSFLF